MTALNDAALAALQARVAYHFRDRSLLEQALTHKSCQSEEAEQCACSNERLEFLGDAVLGMVVAAHLYAIHPDWTEGELTKVKAVAVSEATLSNIGRRLGLGEFLILGKGEEQSGGRARASILADAVEALIGAVFLDCGGDEPMQFPVPRFVLQILGESLEAIARQEHARDYKTMLQEASQEAHRMLPSYSVADESGPDHAKTFVVEVRLGDRVLGIGRGRSKKEAEQNAARGALEHPDSGLPPKDPS